MRPAHIPLAKSSMPELVLGRPDERQRSIRVAARDLRFLVLNGLHTCRPDAAYFHLHGIGRTLSNAAQT